MRSVIFPLLTCFSVDSMTESSAAAVDLHKLMDLEINGAGLRRTETDRERNGMKREQGGESLIEE